MKTRLPERDPVMKAKFARLCTYVRNEFGKKPDLNALLFLVGIQEVGLGPRTYSKEEKQDLMHVAVCKLLSSYGLYSLRGLDQEGWPIWEMVETLPRLNLPEQEILLQYAIVEYFENELGLDFS